MKEGNPFGPEHSQDSMMFLSTKIRATSLEDNMQQLTLGIAAATTLPPSSPPMASLGSNLLHESTSPSSPFESAPRPIQRAPSSNSIGNRERTVTPSLQKRASYSSLKGGSGGVTPPRSPVIRRTSSNLLQSTQPGISPRSGLSTSHEEPERIAVNAASIAKDFFQKELAIHGTPPNTEQGPKMVVILQDDCYSHRYSRPRTSRASLGTIVERPERIHACILGLATAYVRLGGRHAEGHTPPHPTSMTGNTASLPFRIHKTSRRVPLTSPAVTAVHGTKWMSELQVMCDEAESKLTMNGKELTRPPLTDHFKEKGSDERPKLHEGDLYLCSGSLSALEGALGGVCEAVDTVFQQEGPKQAFVCIRPPGHHCSADMPSGFCWLNNIHVAINHATRTHELTHAAIIDFDLHHGDGSQSVAWAHNARVAGMPRNTAQSKKTAIGYFSLHDINSYPCEMGDDEKVKNASICLENAHGQTIWNIHLQPWKTEKEFWDLYRDRYSVILFKVRAFLRLHTDRLRQAPLHPQPKAAIFLSAGFDASEWESPGMQRHQVNVPTDFYARFTRDIIALANEDGLGVDGRVISVLEGGYSDRALMSGVLSHISGLATSEDVSDPKPITNGLGLEMNQRLGKLDTNVHARKRSGNVHYPAVERFTPEWWALSRLEEIERLSNPAVAAMAPKNVGAVAPSTYSSATQSSTAKIVAPPPNRRSLSGSSSSFAPSTTSSPRAPTPPPPPVDWATAAFELSKLLVPSDRQTYSCKPEDLNAEATRVRRDRQSTVGLPPEMPANEGKRMQLRGRKAKLPKPVSEEDEDRPVSRANRRKTIADVTALNQEAPPLPAAPVNTSQDKMVKTKARRSSMVSTATSIGGDKSLALSSRATTNIQPQQEASAIKRIRTPSSSHVDLAKSQGPKQQLPKSRVLTNHEKALRSPRESATHQAGMEPPIRTTGTESNEEDQIVSEMKMMSIKLDIPSKEEQKIREAKRKPAAPRGRPKSTAAKMGKPAVTAPKQQKQNTTIGIDPATATSTGETNTVKDELPHTISSEDAHVPIGIQAVPENPRIQSPTQTAVEPVPISSDPPSFMPPSAPTIPVLAPSTEESVLPMANPQLNILPELKPEAVSPDGLPSPPSNAMSPTTPKRTRQDLPVFTSTSPIVFGNPATMPSSIGQTLGTGPVVNGEDGERAKYQTNGNVKTGPTIPSNQQLGSGTFQLETGKGSGVKVKEEEQDIFDMPDSP